MLDLRSEAMCCVIAVSGAQPQSLVAVPGPPSRGLAAELCRFIAHRAGAAAKSLGDAGQSRGHGLTKPIRGLPRTRGRPSAGSYESFLERTKPAVDLAEVGGYGAGIS